MTKLSTELFGTGNYLKCDDLCPRPQRLSLGRFDPKRLRDEIGISRVRHFPTIQAGVRFWPFLLVANELRDTASRIKVESTLRKIRKGQLNYKKKGLYRREFGPRQLSTFRAYQSMYSNLMKMTDGNSSGLRAFLKQKKRYRGAPAFFRDNAFAWRKVLRQSMGQPGHQFAKLLTRFQTKTVDSPVDSAIAVLLKKTTYNKQLRQAAFGYAFLRCVYGIQTKIEGIPTVVSPKDWANMLAPILSNPPRDLRRYQRFLGLVEKSKTQPVLRQMHLRARRENATVLASLGFHVFYNLYIAHTPTGTYDA